MQRIARLEGHDTLPALFAEEGPRLPGCQDIFAEMRVLRLRQHANGAAQQMIARVGKDHAAARMISPPGAIDAFDVSRFVPRVDVADLKGSDELALGVDQCDDFPRLERAGANSINGEGEGNGPGVLLRL